MGPASRSAAFMVMIATKVFFARNLFLGDPHSARGCGSSERHDFVFGSDSKKTSRTRHPLQKPHERRQPVRGGRASFFPSSGRRESPRANDHGECIAGLATT